jgi:hypothetical protein
MVYVPVVNNEATVELTVFVIVMCLLPGIRLTKPVLAISCCIGQHPQHGGGHDVGPRQDSQTSHVLTSL